MSKGQEEQFARHSQTGCIILSRDNAVEAYIDWKEALIDLIDLEHIPADYLKVEKYSDHLTQQVAKPTLADMRAATATEEERQRLRTIQVRGWNQAEAMVRNKVVTHLQGNLRDTFQRADTCYNGWMELNKVISYDKESQANILDQQLLVFAQRVNKSDINYAERFQPYCSN